MSKNDIFIEEKEMIAIRAAPVTLTIGSPALSNPRLQTSFIGTLREHGIRATVSSTAAGVDLTINSAATALKIREAVEEFNRLYLEASQFIDSSGLLQDYETPSLFSRVVNFHLPRLGMKLSDLRQRYLTSLGRQQNRDSHSSLALALQAATCAALEANGKDPQQMLDSFYRNNSGSPEEVRALLNHGSWSGQDSFINAVRSSEVQLETWWQGRFRRALNHSERILFRSIRESFQAGSSSEKAQHLEEALNSIADGSIRSWAQADDYDYSSVIKNLRILASHASRRGPGTVDDTRELLWACQDSLLRLSELIRVKPRLNWRLTATAFASIGVSAAYLGYRTWMTAILFPISPIAGIVSLALLLSESYYLVTGAVTTSSILRLQLQARGGDGHLYMQPIRSGLLSDPYTRESHCFHLPIVNPAYGGIFWNIQSQVTATRFYGPRGFLAIANNSDQNLADLAVQSGINTGRKTWARADLITELLQRNGVDRVAAYNFSIHLAGGYNQWLDPESLYQGVEKEAQECARQFLVDEAKVKRFGALVAEEFERRHRESNGSYFTNQLSEDWIFGQLINIGVRRDLAATIAGKVFRKLEEMSAQACLSQIGRKLFAEVDCAASLRDLSEPALNEKLERTSRRLFGLGTAASSMTVDDEAQFLLAATVLGLGVEEDAARGLFIAIRNSAQTIQDITAVIVCETDEEQLSGEFRVDRTRSQPEVTKAFMARARVFNALYNVFTIELEDGGVPFSSARKLAQFCQRALMAERKVVNLTPCINPVKKELILNRAEEIGERIAEALEGEASGNLMVRIAHALGAVESGADPAPEVAKVVSDYRRNVVATINRVICDEFHLGQDVANSVCQDFLDNFDASFDATFLHFGLFSEEMFQRICRRAQQINTELNKPETVSSPEKRAGVIDGQVRNLIGRGEFRNNLISVVIKLFGYNRGAFTYNTPRELSEVVQKISDIMADSGDFVAEPSRMVTLLERRMGLSRDEAEEFVRILSEKYQATWMAMGEAIEAVVRAVGTNIIVAVAPPQVGGSVRFAGCNVVLEDFKKKVNQAVRFGYVPFQGGEKAGTTGSCFWGGTPLQAVRTMGGTLVQRLLEERMGGLRRGPRELITFADFEVVNNFRRDLPPEIDPHFRDPHFVVSFMIDQVRSLRPGMNAAHCVRNFLEVAGVRSPVNERVWNGLFELVQRLEGRLAMGRLTNALGNAHGRGEVLDVSNFVDHLVSGNNDQTPLPDLSEAQLYDLREAGRVIQERVRDGLYCFAGSQDHWTIRLTPQAVAALRDREDDRLDEYNQALGNHCSSSRISPEAINDLLGIKIWVSKRRDGGQLCDESVTFLGNFGAEQRGQEVSAAAEFGQEVACLIDSGRTTDEIVTALERNHSERLRTQNEDAEVDPEAVKKCLRTAVARIKTGMFLGDLLSTITLIPAGSNPNPNYDGEISATLGGSRVRLNATDEEAENFKAAGYKLAGIIEEIRIQNRRGFLRLETDNTNRLTSVFSGNDLGSALAQQVPGAKKDLEDFQRWAVFDEGPTVQQIVEEDIIRWDVPEVDLGPSALPGRTSQQPVINVRMPLADEYRSLATVIGGFFDDLLEGRMTLNVPGCSPVPLIDRAADLGARSRRTLGGSVDVADRALLQSCRGLTLTGNQLEMNLGLCEADLQNLVSRISDANLRTQLLMMFEECRINLRTVCAQLVEEVLGAMKTAQETQANRGGNFNYNYFNEESSLMPPWQCENGIRIEDEDYRGAEDSYINAAARIREHPSQAHVSHRQSGRNFREPGCPAVFDSGWNAYKTEGNSLVGMHASAGSPVSYSAEAWVNASLYYKVHQKNKKFLGTMNFTTESEDYASVNYLRSVPEIGQKYYRTGGAKWRFCPNPMFCSSLDQGRVSNGSNQDNLLAAIPTYFGRWARGNLGVLINEVGQAMMGAERWSRYSALGAHWLNFAFRTTIIIIPPLFVFAKVQAIPMTDPKVFLWLMTLTFAITMGTFIYDMARRGYRPLRRGPLLNRQVFGCMICDFAALSRGNKAIWDGLHNKRPPFEVSPKMTIVPAIKKPISELKLEYTLMLASLFGAIKSGIFVWQTGNPLMMAAGFWCLYHFTMLAAAQLYMNQGVYLQHLDGHYTRKKISEGQLGVEELAGVSRRANFLNEFGRPSYDLGVDPLW